MCPLLSGPNRGYADYQRLENWDTGILFSEANVFHNDKVTSNVEDVSRFAYIGGIDSVSSGATFVLFTWFADAAGTIVLGTRSFGLHSSMGGRAQYRLPNLGPFVQVEWDLVGAATFTHSCNIFATNRFHPLEFIPTVPQLIRGGLVAVPAGGTVDVFPLDYYAGPARVFTQTPGTLWTWVLEDMLANNTFATLDEQSLASGNNSTLTITPPGAWKVALVNSSAAAGSAFLSMMFSATGSS